MAANGKYFQDPLRLKTLLAANAFSDDGVKLGGIKLPQQVDIPAGSNLARFYHEEGRNFGEWWITLHELSVVIDYFGLSDLSLGRAEGKGIFQATLAVRHEWSGNSPMHLGRFHIVELKDPLKAYFGEGDDAADATYASVKKAYYVMEKPGQQRRVRQVFLPRPWEYTSSFSVKTDGLTDNGLFGALKRFSVRRLPFEP